MEELESKLLEYLDKTEDLLDQAWMFGAEQVPILIQELLIFKGINYLFWALLFLIPSVLFQLELLKSLRAISASDANTYDKDYDKFTSSILIGACILPILFGGFCLMNALKVFIAPRLFLLEYAASLT